MLKVGVSDTEFKPFISQGEAPSFESPFECVLPCHGRDLWQDWVSVSPTLFNVCFCLFAQCVAVGKLVYSLFVVRESCSICSYRSGVFVVEGEFWFILNQNQS